MTLPELQAIIVSAGGGSNALAYAEFLLDKINRLETSGRYENLLSQLRSAREPGDFRGRVLEVNFACTFVEHGIELAYGASQGMTGDIDFLWNVAEHKVFIELKLLGQDRATRDEINRQLEAHGVSSTLVTDDARDVSRLQLDILQKASTRKFNPHPQITWVNLVAIDVAELQLGTMDIADCLLATGGNALVSQHCHPACLRENVVGVFEVLQGKALTPAQTEWVSRLHTLAAGVPQPQSYLHGVIFLFRVPKERAALSYELSASGTQASLPPTSPVPLKARFGKCSRVSRDRTISATFIPMRRPPTVPIARRLLKREWVRIKNELA